MRSPHSGMAILAEDLSPSDIERFWSKVDASGVCWTWTSWRARGYGRFHHRGHSLLAHRVSYAIANGASPGGLVIAHSCDNPGCVRPDHLWVTTQTGNAHDRECRGRGNQPSGTRNGKSKLTETDVGEIRRMVKSGRSMNSIAPEFGVTVTAVRDIITGRTWKSAGGVSDPAQR